MLLQRLRSFSTVTVSLTVSLLSGYYTIEERRIKGKCKEQRIGKIKSIGRYTVWKFTSYSTFFSKAESCRTSNLREHSLPVLKLKNRCKQPCFDVIQQPNIKGINGISAGYQDLLYTRYRKLSPLGVNSTARKNTGLTTVFLSGKELMGWVWR